MRKSIFISLMIFSQSQLSSILVSITSHTRSTTLKAGSMLRRLEYALRVLNPCWMRSRCSGTNAEHPSRNSGISTILYAPASCGNWSRYVRPSSTTCAILSLGREGRIVRYRYTHVDWRYSCAKDQLAVLGTCDVSQTRMAESIDTASLRI